MKARALHLTSKHIEIGMFAAAIVAANAMLFLGSVSDALIFFPARISAGEWWRVLTFPFVHVSWYHLLMDAGAFLFLYHSLHETRPWKRLAYVGACAVGSLGVSLIASPLDSGLCGLSGIAHGLMAIAALESARSEDRTLRNAGIVCFLVVVLKSVFEAITGHVVFEFLHVGTIASPVSICHAGGVLGGLCVYAFLSVRGNHRPQSVTPHNSIS